MKQSRPGYPIKFLTGGQDMASTKLTIKLTDDQQNQIKAATGRSISELNIDLAATSNLSEQDLDSIVGGSPVIMTKI
jgi:hypothetical protein